MPDVADYGLQFSDPRIVMTKFGEREVRDAVPTEQFWQAWRDNKVELKKAGFSVGKYDGDWKVTLWAQTMSQEVRAAANAASRATDAAIDIPAPPGLEYMPFQRAGIAYALEREATLIGDEMGLGKTIQAIGFANTIKAQRILVVAPASLLFNWYNEIKKWQMLDLPITVVRPNKSTFNRQPGWFIINYDIVSKYREELTRATWDLVIYDECQYMKSRNAQRTVALLGGFKKDKVTKQRKKVEGLAAVRRLMLTGTPIMNRPAELYTILHHLDPKRWGTWSSFAKRYCGAHFDGYTYKADGATNLDELNLRLRETVMVRRLKKDVLAELPPKRRQIVSFDIDDENVADIVNRENDAYDRNEKAMAMASALLQRAEVEGDEAAYQAAVAKLHEVQGIAFTEMAKLRHETAVAKLPFVIEHLKQTTDKILVFAWHQDVVDAIAEAMKDEGVCIITGKTPKEARQPLVDRFQTDPSVRVFVLNIKAGGVGLTLTASSHVIFAELDWTPSNITQAEDRAHRIGQRESVLVQHLVFDDSLDARMAKVAVAKQKVMDQALDKKIESEPDREMIVIPPDPEAVAEKVKADGRRAQLDALAAKLTPEQIAAIHSALRCVASLDADHASRLNDMGFNRMDTIFGCELAEKDRLSPRQAAAAWKMVRKYRRQYPADLYERIFGGE